MNKISQLKRDRDKQKHIYNKIVPNMIKLTHVPLLVFLLDLSTKANSIRKNLPNLQKLVTIEH